MSDPPHPDFDSHSEVRIMHGYGFLLHSRAAEHEERHAFDRRHPQFWYMFKVTSLSVRECYMRIN
jgi:hypothetical protein